MQWVALQGPQGEVNRVLGLFDTGCQVGALDKTYYERAVKRMGKLTAPTKRLRMADGTLVDTYGTWGGTTTVGGVSIKGEFDVFDSHGGWTILFGKPLLAAIGAVHDVRADVVTVSGGGQSAVLENCNPAVWKNEINAAAMAARRKASTGVKSCAIPPARRVQSVSRMRGTHPPPTRGPATKASTAATLGAPATSKRHEASTGASSCETPPVRRVESAFVLRNADAGMNTGAFIEELIDDVYDEFEETKEEDTGLEVGFDEDEEEAEWEVEMELGTAVEEDIRTEEVEAGVDERREEEERGVGNDGWGRRDEVGEARKRMNGEGTRGDKDEGGTGNAETRVASTGVKSSATPPARRVHSAVLQTILEADEDFLDASEEGSDSSDGEESEWEEDRGDAATRAAFTGVSSCETPPARRVHPSDLRSARDADGSSIEVNEERVDEAGESEETSGEETNGDALKREASTGASSCETPPARRVHSSLDWSATIANLFARDAHDAGEGISRDQSGEEVTKEEHAATQRAKPQWG
jgi:hypothetical protein